MIRTNLCLKPTETIGTLDGDPSKWQDFENGSPMPLQPGQYVISCNVTERKGTEATIQYWDEINRLRLCNVHDAAIGVNVIRIYLSAASNDCHFCACACRATDFLVERADTYDAAVGGGLPGFFTGDTMPRA